MYCIQSTVSSETWPSYGVSDEGLVCYCTQNTLTQFTVQGWFKLCILWRHASLLKLLSAQQLAMGVTCPLAITYHTKALADNEPLQSTTYRPQSRQHIPLSTHSIPAQQLHMPPIANSIAFSSVSSASTSEEAKHTQSLVLNTPLTYAASIHVLETTLYIAIQVNRPMHWVGLATNPRLCVRIQVCIRII